MSWVMKVPASFLARRAGILNQLLAMKKMAASNVLVVGVQGLGVEIGRVPSSLAVFFD